MTAATYLRVGRAVYPVYGDALRGWSPDAGSAQAFRYTSLDELFFALVNLWALANEQHGQADAPRGH